MLGSLCSVKQASICDGFAFDPFSFQQDDPPASEVSISRDQIVDALVIAQTVVVRDEGVDLDFEIVREEHDQPRALLYKSQREAVVGEWRWRSSLGGKIDRKIRLGLTLDRRAHGGAIIDATGRFIGLACVYRKPYPS